MFALDPQTGEMRSQFLTRYKPAVTLSSDGGTLYVVDTFLTRAIRGDQIHALTAFNVQTGLVDWEIDLPGVRAPYMGDASTGIWTSVDGHRLYILMGTALGQSEPRVVVVNTTSHQVEREIHISLPSDPRVDWPFLWKLPWSDTMVVVSGAQLFSVDLSNGQRENEIRLPGFHDQSRIPANLAQWVEVEGGAIAAQAHRLYLATNAQDIIAIDLSGSPKSERVFTLPSDWEFGLARPVIVSEDGRFIYLGVRRIASPIYRARTAEQVWSYDTINWQQRGTVSPTTTAIYAAGTVDQGAFSMALSSNGHWLYTINYEAMSLSIIDSQAMAEVKVVRGLEQANISPLSSWIISP